MDYAGFWRRFGAYWIDVLIFVPMAVISYYLSETSRYFHLYAYVPGLLIGLLLHVYMVTRYGGTPGKLLLKIRIAMLDGTPITLNAAFVRYSVLFVLSALSSLALVIAALKMTDDVYFTLGYMARTKAMVELAPSWYQFITIAIQVWVWSEFISMLFNKKRRALHDFMAGTVVVRSAAIAEQSTNTESSALSA